MSDFALGLIEGFYGRQWTWEERRDMAAFLSAAGYTHYIYAPKGDRALRAEWREPFSAQWLSELGAFGAHCHALGLRWGLGLSPMGLQQHYASEDRATLARTLESLERLAPDQLWLLFDDMRGDHAQLAENQCAVSADICWQFSGSVAVCPSYYSSDPVLDQVFGPRPDNYLRDLSRGLNQSVDILWTGEKVISDSLGATDCAAFARQTGRKPLLWDNYPVNDGRLTSTHLHINAFTRRSTELKHLAAGHFVNPMNQCALSKLALSSLPAVYAAAAPYDVDAAREQAFAALPAALATLLRRDWALFQYQGLNAIDPVTNARLQIDYAQSSHSAAREIVAWLAGEYRFDPACLTG